MSEVEFRPINRLPSGLNKLLGISGPDTPDRLMGTVSPGVDLLPWWLFSGESTLAVATSVPAGSVGLIGPGVSAPAGSAWIITRLGFWLTAQAATNNLQIRGCLIDPASSEKHPVGDVSAIWTNAGAGTLDSFQQGRDGCLFVPPGYQVHFNVELNTGTAACTVRTIMRVVQFQV